MTVIYSLAGWGIFEGIILEVNLSQLPFPRVGLHFQAYITLFAFLDSRYFLSSQVRNEIDNYCITKVLPFNSPSRFAGEVAGLI